MDGHAGPSAMRRVVRLDRRLSAPGDVDRWAETTALRLRSKLCRRLV